MGGPNACSRSICSIFIYWHSGAGEGKSYFANKYYKRGFFLTANYFRVLLLTHSVSKTGKFQYFVTLISFQWPATCKFQESSLLETVFVVFENAMRGEPAALPQFFVPWRSPPVGLGFQNGCSQAEVTESLSPHVSPYPSFPQQAERLNLNEELLLTCCRLQLKMTPNRHQFAM